MVSAAVAVTWLVPALAVATPPTGITLLYPPGVVPLTATRTTQEPPAGIVPALKPTLVATVLKVPPQVPVAGAWVVKPRGSTSVKATPVIGTAFGLLKVMSKSDGLPALIPAGVKLLTIDGLDNIWTLSVNTLLAVLAAGSPPPLTSARLLSLGAAESLTLTVTIIGS